MPSLKSNFLYSSILTTAGYVFPLLTYPYVTRVLGVEKIGLCNFIDSIISYFILFSMMGISVTGIREVARVKHNQQKLNSVFSSLLLLNTIFTFVAIIGLLSAFFLVGKLHEEPKLLLSGATKLLFNYLLIEWLFKGLEDFKYITIRTILTRSAFVITIFIFVKNIDDYQIYYALLCGMTVLNAIVNLIYSKKFVSFSLRNISFGPYIKSFLILGINGFLISMYTTFNVAYLGFISNDTEVGYYTTATKLYAIILSLYTAFTGVMLPRMSSLINEKKSDEFLKLLNKSLSFLLCCSIPAILYIEFYAPQIVVFIAGQGYEGAITPMRIVMPLVLIIGYEQVLIIQTLMPLKQDSIIFRNSIIGAIIGVVLNMIIVPYLYSIGSALVWLISETTILILAQLAVKKAIDQKFPFKELSKIIFSYGPLALTFFICKEIIDIQNYMFIISGILTIIYFVCLHRYIFKDEIGIYIKRFF